MNDSEYKPISIGDWILTFILLAIPVVDLVMLIIWAVSVSTHPSKKTFARAYLILIGLIFCVGILAAFILPALGFHPHPTPAVQ